MMKQHVCNLVSAFVCTCFRQRWETTPVTTKASAMSLSQFLWNMRRGQSFKQFWMKEKTSGGAIHEPSLSGFEMAKVTYQWDKDHPQYHGGWIAHTTICERQPAHHPPKHMRNPLWSGNRSQSGWMMKNWMENVHSSVWTLHLVFSSLNCIIVCALYF